MKNRMCDEKIDDCGVAWRKGNLFRSMRCALDVTHSTGFAADIFSITCLVYWLSPLLSSSYTPTSTTVLIVSGLHTSNSG